jgi:hypothetical protein
VLRKDAICLMPVQNDKVFRKWLMAVGQGGSALCSGVPVHEAIYRAFQRNGATGASEGFIRELYRNTSHIERSQGVLSAVVDATARVSYWQAFGVTPDEQIAIESAFSSLTISEWNAVPISHDMLNFLPGISSLATYYET